MRKAFTLLELLVVIGIIAILVGLGSVSYSTAQKKARDAKRSSDLNSAQKMMEQCYAVNSYSYPIITNSSGTLIMTCPAPNNSITFSITDPLNSGSNYYRITPTPPYTIQAVLENGNIASVSAQQ